MATLHKLLGNCGKYLTSNSLSATSNVLYLAEFDTASGKLYSIVNWRAAFTDPNNGAVTVPAQWVIVDKGYVLAQIAAGTYQIASGVVAKLAPSTAIAPVNGYSGLAADVFDNDTALRAIRVWVNDLPFTILGSGVTAAYIQTVVGTAYLTLDPAVQAAIEAAKESTDPAADPARSADLLTTATDFVKKNWLLILVVLVVLYFLYTEFFGKKKKGKR